MSPVGVGTGEGKIGACHIAGLFFFFFFGFWFLVSSLG